MYARVGNLTCYDGPRPHLECQELTCIPGTFGWTHYNGNYFAHAHPHRKNTIAVDTRSRQSYTSIATPTRQVICAAFPHIRPSWILGSCYTWALAAVLFPSVPRQSCPNGAFVVECRTRLILSIRLLFRWLCFCVCLCCRDGRGSSAAARCVRREHGEKYKKLREPTTSHRPLVNCWFSDQPAKATFSSKTWIEFYQLFGPKPTTKKRCSSRASSHSLPPSLWRPRRMLPTPAHAPRPIAELTARTAQNAATSACRTHTWTWS